jgi:argininosuccinate lyase
MTPDERIAELHWLLHSDGADLIAKGFTTFAQAHKRVGELVGRDVHNHELLYEDELAEEIRTGNRPSVEDIVMRLQMAMGPDKPVIVVDTDSGDVRRVQ